jgi:DNA-binding NarL/FixJ family response regulator
MDVSHGPIRVVLAGTERVTRAGLRILIDSHPGLKVIAEVETASHLSAVVSTEQPNVVVIDLEGLADAELIPDAQQTAQPYARTIVLTSAPESEACTNAIKRGVAGVVSKHQTPEILITAIERVHAGEVWLNRAQMADILGELRKSLTTFTPRTGPVDVPVFTRRECQIIALVGHGYRNSEIASTIFTSEATVRNCLGSIFRKLGITNRVHLMIYAMKEGYANLPDSERATPSSPRDVLRLVAGRALGDRNRS